MSPVIRVEDLSKRYRLGTINHGMLFKDLQAGWARVRGKPDPFQRVGEKDRSHKGEFWALRGISFDVNQGDVVGIVGRNGAGKSTLLKILSQVTLPTQGYAKLKGRVASLLEVGTGFHPELTGRQNIYLNGAIFGLAKSDISSRLEEIVDFAAIGEHIDTPVKRYSSGMHVRLAFSVAAHLEPDILIVDEVLAVGDAEFQKKCLGKLSSVGKTGRTILFVSHNMAAVTSLCKSAILLENGRLSASGSPPQIIKQYFASGSMGRVDYSSATEKPGNQHIQLISAHILNSKGEVTEEISIDDSLAVEMEFTVEMPANSSKLEPNFRFFASNGELAFLSCDPAKHSMRSGRYIARCNVPANFLNNDTYSVAIALTSYDVGVDAVFYDQNLAFSVVDKLHSTPSRGYYMGTVPGYVRPLLKWDLNRIE
jgi:lipopolysaccharide transport system ATP-binding protein